jgi:hypothetical protein
VTAELFVQAPLMAIPSNPYIAKVTDSTFVDNMRLPVHRWFRYSAGFSAQWVEAVIEEAKRSGPVSVFDPFVGSGTTLVAAEACQVPSIGLEAHPFVARIARAKMYYRSDPNRLLAFAAKVRETASRLEGSVEGYPPLIRRCFDDASLAVLDTLRRAWICQADGSPECEIVWLALVAILRPVSRAGTAPWQYVLPDKTKTNPLEPAFAFDRMIRTVWSDMQYASTLSAPVAQLIQGDARSCEMVPADFASLVITSPPYPNNYDYADATRLEMSFLGEVQSWGDLQDSVRTHLVRSCSQHLSERTAQLEELLSASELSPIRGEIEKVCNELAITRLQHGGRKTYHLMVAAYFLDLAKTWQALRRVCQSSASVCFVIGDSAPYGVYVPVIDWMSVLAINAGFSSSTFEKVRDRNIKWKNRKHRVPLCEGHLWVKS